MADTLSTLHTLEDDNLKVIVNTTQPIESEGGCSSFCIGAWTKVTEIVLDNYKTPIFWIAILWLLVVIVSGAILFMAIVGMIQFTTVEIKNYVVEVNSQILNALFTGAAVYNQPPRAFNLVLLIAGEYNKLKETYPWACPDKRNKLWILIVILNLNCVFQYPMAITMWAYIPAYTERPGWSVGVFLSLSFLCAISGGVLEGVFASEKKDDMTLQKYNNWK